MHSRLEKQLLSHEGEYLELFGWIVNQAITDYSNAGSFERCVNKRYKRWVNSRFKTARYFLFSVHGLESIIELYGLPIDIHSVRKLAQEQHQIYLDKLQRLKVYHTT